MRNGNKRPYSLRKNVHSIYLRPLKAISKCGCCLAALNQREDNGSRRRITRLWLINLWQWFIIYVFWFLGYLSLFFLGLGKKKEQIKCKWVPLLDARVILLQDRLEGVGNFGAWKDKRMRQWCSCNSVSIGTVYNLYLASWLCKDFLFLF